MTPAPSPTPALRKEGSRKASKAGKATLVSSKEIKEAEAAREARAGSRTASPIQSYGIACWDTSRHVRTASPFQT